MAICLIALGANIGDKERTIESAIRMISASNSNRILHASKIYQTVPIGGPAGQQSFANAALLVETEETSQQVLNLLLQIEVNFGRQREIRWQARTLDLDLLLYDKQILATARFVLPHPRMTFRRFVLEPAAEIAADLMHPIAEMTIGQLLSTINLPSKLVLILCDHPKSVENLSQQIGKKEKISAAFDWQQAQQLLRRQSGSSEPVLFFTSIKAGNELVSNLTPQPKLLVALIDCQPDRADQLQFEAKQEWFPFYKGPYLVASANDIDRAAVELIAALQAMR